LAFSSSLALTNVAEQTRGKIYAHSCHQARSPTGRKILSTNLNCQLVAGLFGVLICVAAVNQPSSAQAAGNVQAQLENGDLIITGDDRDNNIIVIQECCSTVIVKGRADTTVNGSASRFDTQVTHDIIIGLNHGNDFVRVEVVPGVGGTMNDLKIRSGTGDDTVELLGVTVQNDTRIETGDGDDVIFIDGVQEPNGYQHPNFTGRFSVDAGTGQDLLEFHHAIFRGEVNVTMGSGIDGVCNTEDSDFLQPDRATFDGGPPNGFPGDGFVAPIIQLPHIINFEEFPDDCSFLGGRD